MLNDEKAKTPDCCPDCGAIWRHSGPWYRLECDSGHLFDREPSGALTPIHCPQFTDQQIRDAEVELYVARLVDELPAKRRAISLLRSRYAESLLLSSENTGGSAL